jgi:conjugal transfer pilus assembly protein TraK
MGVLADQAQSIVMELGARNVSITSSTTASIEIAIDHLNRLVTPFANRVVRTVSAASTSVDGYVDDVLETNAPLSTCHP